MFLDSSFFCYFARDTLLKSIPKLGPSSRAALQGLSQPHVGDTHKIHQNPRDEEFVMEILILICICH